MEAHLKLCATRLAAAYFGATDDAGINPSIIALLEQLVQQFLATCTPPVAVAKAKSHPILIRPFIKNMTRNTAEAMGMLSMIDVNKAADSIITTARQSTPEEATAYLAASQA